MCWFPLLLPYQKRSLLLLLPSPVSTGRWGREEQKKRDQLLTLTAKINCLEFSMEFSGVLRLSSGCSDLYYRMDELLLSFRSLQACPLSGLASGWVDENNPPQLMVWLPEPLACAIQHFHTWSSRHQSSLLPTSHLASWWEVNPSKVLIWLCHFPPQCLCHLLVSTAIFIMYIYKPPFCAQRLAQG